MWPHVALSLVMVEGEIVQMVDHPDERFVGQIVDGECRIVCA